MAPKRNQTFGDIRVSLLPAAVVVHRSGRFLCQGDFLLVQLSLMVGGACYTIGAHQQTQTAKPGQDRP